MSTPAATVHRTYKVRLYPTRSEQERLFYIWQAVKLTYNLCIEQRQWFTRTGKQPTLVELAEYNDARRDAQRNGEPWEHPLGELPDRIPRDDNGKAKPVANLSRFDQAKYLPALHEARGWSGHLPAKVLHQAVADVDAAMKSFYGLVKVWRNGELDAPPAPPRFKSIRSPVTIGFANHGGVKIFSPYSVRVKGVGRVHTKATGIPEGLEPYQSNSYIEISRDRAGQWWLHILFKNVPRHLVAPREATGQSVGVDLGITHLATTSDGKHLANVRPLEQVLDHVRHADKALDRLRRTYFRRNNIKDTPHNRKQHSRTAWSSVRGRRLRAQKNRLLVKATQTRSTIIKQAVAALVYKYDVIVLEDLNVRGLGSGRLARHVKDVGWGFFYKELARKAEELGVEVLYVDPRNTSRTCPECGYIAKGNRATQSVFRCGRCDHTANADVNGARNILTKAQEGASVSRRKTTRRPSQRRRAPAST